MRHALLCLLAATALVTGCATPPTKTPPTAGDAEPARPDPVPRPAPADPSVPAATPEQPDPVPDAKPPESAAGGGSTPPQADAAETAPDPVPAPPVPTPAPEGDYFPDAAGARWFAGLRSAGGGKVQVLSIEVTSQRDDGHDNGRDNRRIVVTESVRAGDDTDSLGDARQSRHEVLVTADAIRIAVLADAAHARPDPVVELPLPPVPGASWQVRNRFVAVDCEVLRVESVPTFEGPIPHCALVELRTTDGARVTQRWYHPTRGLVRSETRDARGKLTYGKAHCGKEPPTAADIRRLFDTAQ